MSRHVQPELLDHLPADNPLAVRARADLRRVNRWMGNPRHVARLVRATSRDHAPLTLADLGTGDATWLQAALARLPRPPPERNHLLLIDRQPVVDDATLAAFRRLGWDPTVVGDEALHALSRADALIAQVIVANLFLHHLDDAALRRLFAQAATRCDQFVACEPRRSRWTKAGARLLWLIGCHRVTRGDARISVDAGFAGRELSRLWPAGECWQLHERDMGLFSHCFAASRLSRTP